MAITKQEFRDRQQRAVELAAERGYEALITYSAHRDYMPGDCVYLANWYSIEEASSLLVLVPGSNPVLFIDVVWDIDRAQQEATVSDTRQTYDYARDVAQYLTSRGVTKGKVAISGWQIFPAPVFEGLRARLPDVTWEDAYDLMYRLRMYKSPAEIELMREAGRLTVLGMDAAVRAAEEGASEYEIAAAAECVIRRQGADLSFATEIGAGTRTWLGTLMPSRYRVKRGDFILFDLGARYQGYHGDMARTLVLGGPEARQLKMLEVVHSALEATLAGLKVGMLASQVHDLGAEVARIAGYGDYWWQAFIPHGNGTAMHEWPKKEHGVPDLPIEPNMVLCIEPGLYIPDLGGARIEQMVLVTDSGSEILTPYPTRLW